MKTYLNPSQEQWPTLAQRQTVASADLNETVKSIFSDIEKNGSKAVKKYTQYFDGVTLENLKVTTAEIEHIASDGTKRDCALMQQTIVPVVKKIV